MWLLSAGARGAGAAPERYATRYLTNSCRAKQAKCRPQQTAGVGSWRATAVRGVPSTKEGVRGLGQPQDALHGVAVGLFNSSRFWKACRRRLVSHSERVGLKKLPASPRGRTWTRRQEERRLSPSRSCTARMSVSQARMRVSQARQEVSSLRAGWLLTAACRRREICLFFRTTVHSPFLTNKVQHQRTNSLPYRIQVFGCIFAPHCQ